MKNNKLLGNIIRAKNGQFCKNIRTKNGQSCKNIRVKNGQFIELFT